jgi:hypothetical protein
MAVKRNKGGRLAGPKIRERVMSEGKKSSSSGFKQGGAVSGGAPASNIAHRARGGRTGAPYSSAFTGGKERDGRSDSGHEGE